MLSQAMVLLLGSEEFPGAVPGAGGLYMLNCLNFSQLLFVS